MRNAEQVLVYNNFIKSKVLKDLTSLAYTNSTSDTLNIYIDTYKMMMDLYEPNLEIKTVSIITSTLINLCAHLRSYYWYNHHVNTNIFLVYSDMSNNYNKTFYPGYNCNNDNKIRSNPRISSIIDQNMELLKILCPYLPDIYFIHGTYEPSVIILDLIYKEEANGNTAPNLVLSRDDIALQIPAYHNNTTIFLDSKRTNSSTYVNNSNAIFAYLDKTGRKKLLTNQTVIDRVSTLDSSLLGLLIALTNLPSRGVKSAYDINKSINIIASAVARKSIINGHCSNPEYFYNGLFIGSEGKLSIDSFVFRYKAIDLLEMHREYMFSPYAKDLSYRVNLDDSNTVRSINNEYFKDNPLDLNRL